ncbi:MAG: hypothetical protein J5585_08725, partial [Clostridia bacterium]|nr:hypothetical protein [Clostridia bacterium]
MYNILERSYGKENKYVNSNTKKTVKTVVIIAVIAILALICITNSYYTVDDKQQAVITTFGKVTDITD